jgi:predicted alpha/beta hydrolase family esterase
MNYLIIHGSYGSPDCNWFGWLKSYLQAKGHTVVAPQFPIGEKQNFDSWKAELEKLVLDKNTVVIAHSIAPVFVVKYLTETRTQIKKLVSVAGFNGFINNKEYDEVNKTFFMDEIKPICKAVCFYSPKDKYVPFYLLSHFAKDLKAKTVIIENAGHFNTESGYTEFNEIIKHLI